jgi:hypothetical protein
LEGDSISRQNANRNTIQRTRRVKSILPEIRDRAVVEQLMSARLNDNDVFHGPISFNNVRNDGISLESEPPRLFGIWLPFNRLSI